MLQKILDAREERWNERCRLADEYSLPVITITLNIPGPNKVGNKYAKAVDLILTDFKRAVLEDKICIKHLEPRVGDDGPEAYIVIEGNAEQAKMLAVEIEETHPLGRLADIDIMDKDKKCLSRKDFGMPERKCIVCGGPANVCIVGRRHFYEDIITRIEKLLDVI